jgi:Uma2 family endonuclease
MTAATTVQTFADVLALGSDARVELLDGRIVPKAAPVLDHAYSQGALITWANLHVGQPPGAGAPGGCVFGADVDIRLAADTVVRPDVAGWRTERVPRARWRDQPMGIVPDWVCEVLSESNWRQDWKTKMRLYAQARIPHYWILDPVEQTLTVLHASEGGYLVVREARAGETVRVEPFETQGLRIDDLFGIVPDGPTG